MELYFGCEDRIRRRHISEWLGRDLPEPDYVLGELLSTTTRANQVVCDEEKAWQP
jgi:hypothetical protein